MSTQHELLHAIATATGFTMGQLRGPRKIGPIVRARFVAAWMLRELCGLSYPQIGQALGGRDHTTAMNACYRIRDSIHDDRPLAHYLADVIGAIADRAGYTARVDRIHAEVFG